VTRELLMKLSDAAILLEWGGVFIYFLRRFVKMRKVVSLALAGMSLGWLILGLGDISLRLSHGFEALKVLALGLGAFLWWSVWRVEKKGK